MLIHSFEAIIRSVFNFDTQEINKNRSQKIQSTAFLILLIHWSLEAEFIYLEKIQIVGRRVFVLFPGVPKGAVFPLRRCFLNIPGPSKFKSSSLENDAWKTIRASFLGLG